MGYVDRENCLAVSCGNDDNLMLKVIAQHFMGNHPALPFQFKLDFKHGIKMDGKGRYVFDFNHYFPRSRISDCCYAKGKLWSYHERDTHFNLLCIGPTKCYVNDELCYQSNPNEEGKRKIAQFPVHLVQGFNCFTFVTEKTPLGFGFSCGNFMPQWEPYLFQMPGAVRFNQLGFAFTAPLGKAAKGKLCSEDFVYPKHKKAGNPLELNPAQIFGEDWEGHGYVKAAVVMEAGGQLCFSGDTSYCRISINGRKEQRADELWLEVGRHLLVIHFIKEQTQIKPLALAAENGLLETAVPIPGYEDIWLALGPFGQALDAPEKLACMHEVYEEKYWRPLSPEMELRPCVETELFGRFTYPMGVTLYGLLETADYLNNEHYGEYVKTGVEMIARYHDYALFDKKRNGFPSLNQQICWLEELDDCGSFGSLMLECLKYWELEAVRPLADQIANHMRHRQLRQPDNAFCRCNQTMWIDDLYMSIPFLVRYYQLSQDEWYLDEACRQLLLYKQYFFIEEQGLMSHIYDVNWQRANEIPWSRGNGWVIFSLSEIMNILPECHLHYREIVDFFHQFAKGLLAVQGQDGLWHQILDDDSTYSESSSTAMFICAFARSIRMGYASSGLQPRLRESLNRAWLGLMTSAVDSQGNLYGVCQGSGCSFSRDYYRKLSWRYNDAHGIGIVLLAGVEKKRLD